jgi:hypothetical protein
MVEGLGNPFQISLTGVFVHLSKILGKNLKTFEKGIDDHPLPTVASQWIACGNSLISC